MSSRYELERSLEVARHEDAQEVLRRAVGPTEEEKEALKVKRGLVFLPLGVGGVEVGLIENDLVLPRSLNTTRPAALVKIWEYSQDLQKEFPDFRAIMLSSNDYKEVDTEYANRHHGFGLFYEEFAWCLDDSADGRPRFAGRNKKDRPFTVLAWAGGSGWHIPLNTFRQVGAVPAIVKVEKVTLPQRIRWR